MSYHQAKKSCFAMGVLVLLLTGLESLSYGDACSPASPCPCAADGVCRPNRASFGYSRTRWRPWPGEPMEELTDQDAVSGGVGGQDTTEAPKRFEAPSPEQEGLRQPYRDKRDKKKAAKEAAEIPSSGDEVDEPFDLQGSLYPPPTNDDSPPALPESLRQASLSFDMPWIATNPVKMTKRLPRLLQSPAANSVVDTNSTVVNAAASEVVPVAFQQSHSIQLINPASAVLSNADSLPLQQAIYYEKSEGETERDQ